MVDRDFSEVDVRRMLEDATGWRRDVDPSRFDIETRHDGRPWEVVVEPDELTTRLVVITAFPID